MTVLIIAEHQDGKTDVSLRAVVTAAAQVGGDIHVLVAGQGCAAAAQDAATIAGVSKVLLAEHEGYAHALAENLAPLIVKLAVGYTHVLMAATTTGKDVLPRAAALLGVQQISDIIAVEAPDTFARPIYAGNAIETVKTSDAVKCITVRPTVFDKAGDGGTASVEVIEAADCPGLTQFVSLEGSGGDRPDLASAAVVVSGGRGFGSGDKFNALLEPLADKLGAAIGASRAAVDAGYVPNDYQVGQTGKIIAPDLYIAVGISGAIQHLAGIKDAKVIVAINKDENAPIFDIADYGLVGDLFELVPQLTQKL
jgi:electron transfer flavoprotein alpha subunit